MDLAKTSIRLASVASLTKQLNIGAVAAATTGKGDDVVVFQAQRTAATTASTPIPGKDDLFGGG